jgi:hypothetical protein
VLSREFPKDPPLRKHSPSETAIPQTITVYLPERRAPQTPSSPSEQLGFSSESPHHCEVHRAGIRSVIHAFWPIAGILCVVPVWSPPRHPRRASHSPSWREDEVCQGPVGNIPGVAHRRLCQPSPFLESVHRKYSALPSIDKWRLSRCGDGCPGPSGIHCPTL